MQRLKTLFRRWFSLYTVTAVFYEYASIPRRTVQYKCLTMDEALDWVETLAYADVIMVTYSLALVPVLVKVKR
jgi:hypothetical protein